MERINVLSGKSKSKKKILYLIPVLGIVFICIMLSSNLPMRIKLNRSAHKYNFKINKLEFEEFVLLKDTKTYYANIESEDFYKLSKSERNAFFFYETIPTSDRYYIISINSNGYKYDNSNMGRTLDEIEEDEKKLEEEEEAKRIAEEKTLSARYSDIEMPCLGMREEGLPYTKIGKPDKVEPCLNFTHLDKEHKSKKYTWKNVDEHISELHVTVWYQQHNSHYVDDYTDYPDDNGYVESIWMQKDGKVKSSSYTEERLKY